MATSVNFKRVVFYPDKAGNKGSNFDNLNGVNGRIDYNGYLSDSAKKKIRNLVCNFGEALTNSQENGMQLDSIQELYGSCNLKNKQTNESKPMERKLVFLTITLPTKQVHTDNEIKRKCLNSYMITLLRKCDIRVWLWVAELQKNGNIHFHILVDNFIPFVAHTETGQIEYVGTWSKCQTYAKRKIETKLRVSNYAQYLWNKELSKMGYIDEFERLYKHRHPPTANIKIVKNGSSVGVYITKYITKGNKPHTKQSRKIEGRLWGCSDNLKEFENLHLSKEERNSIYKEVVDKGQLVLDTEHVKIYAIDAKEVPLLFNMVFMHFSKIIGSIYCNSIDCEVIAETVNLPPLTEKNLLIADFEASRSEPQ